jgi:NhaP-type Na+/H+ or K+/H+ antiporter
MAGPFAILMFVSTQFIGLLRAYWFNTPYVLIDSTQDVLIEVIGGVSSGVIFGWLMGIMNWSAKESAYRQSEDD